MNLGLLKNKRKQYGFKRFLNSFKYAFNGFKYAYQNEQNLVIHICVTIVTVITGLIFKLNNIEWLFILIMIGLVFCAELINTSIEAVVDLVSPEKHPLAKIAKDTASAAVLSLCVVAFIGGLCIFIPKIWGLFF
ncbi:MAG: diacylglycerol kinase family protein [Firmicutes bacterium]|nr:diacylglycerol kinase family protein [Bacillota bacterium]